MTYRNIIEYSCMSNNDERISYTDKPLNSKDVFSQDKFLVFSRPVYDLEIEEGLKTHKYSISCFDEKIPDITSFLDTLYRLKFRYEGLKVISQKEITIEHIIKYISDSFYDCMSGGMPAYLGSICKRLCEEFPDEIDLAMELYPCSEETKENGWYTLKDFLEEINPPDIDIHLDKMRKKLPSVSSFLLE